MKILTLCTKCKETYEQAFRVRPYVIPNATTKLAGKCENCGKSYKAQIKLYIVDRKGK